MAISCNQHNYIEIACMYHFPIKLTMISGASIEGTAVDTKTNGKQEECIMVAIEDTTKLIKLDDIRKLKVTIENPHFSEVTFQ